MSPENQNTNVENTQLQAELYDNAADYLLESVNEVNQRQLISSVNENLLGPAVKSAIESGFYIQEISAEGSEDVLGAPHSPGAELISFLMIVESKRLRGDDDWAKFIPKETGLTEAIAKVTSNPILGRAYGDALRHRLEELSVQARQHEVESETVSPETERIVEFVEDLGHEAVESAEDRFMPPVTTEAIIDSDSVPLRRQTFQQPEYSESIFAPKPRIESAEVTTSSELKAGDMFSLPMPEYDPVTGKRVSGQIHMEEYVVNGLKTIDGEYMASIRPVDGVFETFIPRDAMLSDPSYQKELVALLTGDHENTPETAESLQSAGTEAINDTRANLADVDSEVMIENENGTLVRGILLGYYGDDTNGYSDTEGEYAGVRLANGSEIGVFADELDRRLQADRAAMFRPPVR